MATVMPKTANWFRYFLEDYRWSSAVGGVPSAAAYRGSDIGEVDRAARSLHEHPGDDAAWLESWRAQGDRVRRLAQAAEKEGRRS